MLRVSFTGSPELMPAAMTLPVLVRPTLTLTGPAPSTTTRASAVRVTGTVAPTVAGAVVELWARAPGSARYVRVATVRTDARSGVSVTLPTGQRGSYAYFLRMPPSSTLLEATSPVRGLRRT